MEAKSSRIPDEVVSFPHGEVGLSKPVRVALSVAAPAPAALLTLCSVLVMVFVTKPIRPYTDGVWATGELILLAVIGAMVGLVSRPMAAAVGIPLGMAAAVALQLFVLAGQAYWEPAVVSALNEPAWTTAVARAILLAFGAIAIGYVVTRGTLVADRIRRGAQGFRIGWPAERRGSQLVVGVTLVALLAALAIAVLLVGGSLLATARSAYVPPEQQPAMRVVIRGSEIVAAEPATVTAGRAGLTAEGAGPIEGLFLVGPLPADQLTALEQERIQYGYLNRSLSEVIRQVDLNAPGTYAFVTSPVYGSWMPPANWDGWVPISDARTFTVGAEPGSPPSTEAGGDGGRQLTSRALAALGIEGWAAAGAVLLARSRHRRLTKRYVAVALTVGLVSAALLGFLVLFAIDQAHNPL